MKRLYLLPWILLATTGCKNDVVYETKATQPELFTEQLPIIAKEHLRFKDHNKNGQLDPFEDWRLSPAQRAADLLSHMTIEEKVGQMLHGKLAYLTEGQGILKKKVAIDFDSANTGQSVTEKVTASYVGAFITQLSDVDVPAIAKNHNTLQSLAETTPHAIPLSVSSDPRHHFTEVAGGSHLASSFSQWPETLGLAALDDVDRIKQFAKAVREEYRAVGINMALHPTADLATEPRWARVNTTFGENADKVGDYLTAFITTLQNGEEGVSPGGVWAVVKHYTGGGPQRDGLDAHFSQGRDQVYPNLNMEYHERPFKKAFEVSVAGVMPYFSVPQEKRKPGEAGYQFNFSRSYLTDKLRQDNGYKGVVLSDWEIVDDCTGPCLEGAKTISEITQFRLGGTPWGVENQSREARYVIAVNAGVDQLGGVDDPKPLLAAMKDGQITIERVDEAVSRILETKFAQGLFENPYANVQHAVKTVGADEFVSAAKNAQAEAFTLLKNDHDALPVSSQHKVYFQRSSQSLISKAQQRGLNIVDSIEEADYIVIRGESPGMGNFALGLLGAVWTAGELSYLPKDAFVLREYESNDQDGNGSYCTTMTEQKISPASLIARVSGKPGVSPRDGEGKELTYNTCYYSGFETYEAIQYISKIKQPHARVVLEVPLRRGIALENVVDKVDAILAQYGASEDALLNVLTGKQKPLGKLPLGLPRSTEKVIEIGKEDTPSFDLPDELTLFPYAYGLNYR